MKLQGYFLLALFYTLPYLGASQEKTDTLMQVSENTDSTIIKNHYTSKDTIDHIADDIMKEIYDEGHVKKSDALYDSIKQIAYKRKLTKVLYDLTFKYSGPDRKPINDTIVKDVGSPYEKFDDKFIGRIEIIRLQPFTEDTIRTLENKLSHIGNDIHVMTHEYVIRNNLLFKKGQEVDPVVLTTTARLLRDLPYIDEVTIQIIPSKASQDSVTVVVVTKDKFPYAVTPIIKSYNDMSFKLWTVNFLGLGHRVDGKFSYDAGRDPNFKIDESNYLIHNIRGTFITGGIGYKKDNNLKRTWSVKFNRPLIVPTIKQSYGINMYNVKIPTTITEPDSTIKDINIVYNTGDIYYAKTFALSPEKKSKIHPAYLSLSSMITRVNYLDKPFMSADSNVGYRNRLSLFGAISISKNNYYLANYYYSFGKTENIPYGQFIQFTGGYEFGNYYNRYYLGFETGMGDFINMLGYYNVRLEVGSFIKENTGNLSQGVLNIKANLASRLYHVKRARIRNYVYSSYTLGFDRLPGEGILLNSNQGLEGLDNNDLKGLERLVTQIESVVFTPWYVYGFSFAVYAFANISTLVPQKENILTSRYYAGFGFGLRIKNENLVFETLQLQLAFYPASPPGADSFNFSSSGISEYDIDGFFVARPGVYSLE